MRRAKYTFLFITLIFCQLSLSLRSQVVINEYSVSNMTGFMDNYGHHEDWFELFNTGSATVYLDGYWLSDDTSNVFKWQFPEGTSIPGQGFIRVWATGRGVVNGNHYHASFRLSQTKDNPEFIVLSTPSGGIVEWEQLQRTQKDHSRGRTTDGGPIWGIFTSPTPNASNNTATAFTKYADAPVMDVEAGFYDDPVTVTISTTEPDSEIHFTTNGSEPQQSDPVYSAPVDISSTTIVIARTFSSNPQILPSFLTFNTYFINESHQLGVISASAEDLDNLLNGNQSLRPFGTFEYFNPEGVRTTFGYGEFNEHGQDSWVHPQRSIDYITRDECGYNYAIREQLIPLTDRDEFQRLILRAAGDDNYPGIDTSAHLRDYFIQNTATKNGMHLDCRKGQKGVLYANGIYWGVYGFREKVSDHDYTKYYYDQGEYDIYYLKLWGGSWAEYGGQEAWDDWNELHDFIKYNDMSLPENWDYVKSRLDYESFVDYILINSYVVCSDWINWNVGWWRGTNPEGEHQRWGYTLWDEDATFNHYINYTGVPGTQPTVAPCYPEGLTNDLEEHIVMLNHLLDNPDFEQYYLSRYVDLYNSVFRPEKMIAYLDSIEAEMEPEMAQHVQRWGGSLAQWKNNVQKIRNFILARHSYLPQGFSSCWNLSGPYEVNYVVMPQEAGKLRVNSLIIDEPGWGGLYFGNILTEIEALETNPNYEFDHWELYNHTPSPSDTSLTITVDFSNGDYIKAVFVPKVYSDSLVINEIMYNADSATDSKDWVEFYNPHDIPLDISGWTFKDDNDNHAFVFPEGTLIPEFGYLVLCRDTASFKSVYPEVTNYMGEMDFGLNSAGELIRLFNQEGVLVDTVHYDNNDPWPTEPDGDGPSLELKYWALDNALPESWVASLDIGTPGAENSYVFTGLNKPPAPEVSLRFYPNPADGWFFVRASGADESFRGNFILKNSSGITVLTSPLTGNNRTRITTGSFPAGIYFGMIADKNNRIVSVEKVIIR
ncbi:MAG: hypothetical protein Kow00127_17510 [Bacteroidales bacterium]